MGGEKPGPHTERRGHRGSPPHGRGKAPVYAGDKTGAGITPAWAGKRSSRCRILHPIQDHPRMGGEKTAGFCASHVPNGSPPHGRGKAEKRNTTKKTTGITPAWAGKSLYGWKPTDLEKDHPRMGGEKALQRALRNTDLGSPPHGRGKAGFKLMQAKGFGITPAWAGKSFPFSSLPQTY